MRSLIKRNTLQFHFCAEHGERRDGVNMVSDLGKPFGPDSLSPITKRSVLPGKRLTITRLRRGAWTDSDGKHVRM